LAAPDERAFLPPVVGVKGTYATRERRLVPRFVQVEYAHKYERMRRQERIDFIDTYSAAYRRDIFMQNGGFDPVFPVPSVEDQEFSFRLASKGYWLVFQPAAVVLHRHDRSLGEYMRRKYGIGYWKAVMINWLPEKTFSDAHTPPSQRWQIVLLGLSAMAGLISLAWRPAGWLALASLAGFFLSALPFAAFALKRDRAVLPIVPGMLLARAAALAAGSRRGSCSAAPAAARVSASCAC
jgi:cellulose synthase/poly-beta-1,6-N-acetylglucosamine synthase-like glycosyltransferase